jgi:hypothetical protein
MKRHYDRAVQTLAPLLFLAAALPIARAGEAPFVREVTPNLFEVGTVRLDKQARTVSFAAQVNMREGLVEYLLVTETGKSHESLLTTKAEPYHVQIAMLLLGAKSPAQAPAPPADQLDAAYLKSAPELSGEPVELSVSWTDPERRQTCPVEDLVFNTETNAPMKRGPWLYTGSLVSNGSFLSQVEGSIIAIVTDPAALVNNPRPGRQNDQVWIPRKELVPPTGTTVEFTITINPPKQKP